MRDTVRLQIIFHDDHMEQMGIWTMVADEMVTEAKIACARTPWIALSSKSPMNMGSVVATSSEAHVNSAIQEIVT